MTENTKPKASSSLNGTTAYHHNDDNSSDTSQKNALEQIENNLGYY